MSHGESASPFLPLPDEIHIVSTHAEECGVIVDLTCYLDSACYPLCRQASVRIHSTYVRAVADLPTGGRRVILKLSMRKFVCSTSTCPRKIFTERIDALVQSYARMTNRLCETLQTLGFATCGELGERLAPKLGMQVSGPTLLRRMRIRFYAPPTSVIILGIDDWAWKKGATYGIILVGLRSRKPIELLPDRSVQTAEAWLRMHPEITVISRDREENYAVAAKRGSPQAKQIADKFHLLKNLRDAIRQLMDQHQSHLPNVENSLSDAIPARAQGKSLPVPSRPPFPRKKVKHYRTIPPTFYQCPPTMSYQAFEKQVRRDKHYVRYEEVRTLSQQGVGIREIARRLKMSRMTIRRFLAASEFPEIYSHVRGEKWSILAPYKPHILERWKQGCRNSVQPYDARARTRSSSS